MPKRLEQWRSDINLFRGLSKALQLLSNLSDCLKTVVFKFLVDLKKKRGRRSAVLITKCLLRNLFCKKALMLYNESYGKFYTFFKLFFQVKIAEKIKGRFSDISAFF